VPKEVEAGLRRRGVHILDATCPRVKKAQLLIEEQARQGRRLLLYGEEEHPEVRGLLSYAGEGAFVFDTKEKLDEFRFEPGVRYSLAAQTTQDKEMFNRIAEALRARDDLDVKVLETICDATRLRQEEAVRIAREVDFMIVVGGFISGNTRRLVQVVADQGTPCIHVETAGELPLEKLRGYRRIGITAGASTPRELVESIQAMLRTL
jgi:4-hydroxy-3-methylbut-2-enyl diphosphate reductase